MMGTLQSHYNNILEGDRLFRTKANSIEFYTTCHFIEQHLQPNQNILELGSGHGIYSYHFAQQGYEIIASDIVEENITIINQLITPQLKPRMKTMHLDATDLSSISDNTFDMTLCLGPLYHLRNEKSRAMCLTESARVTKPDGYIAFAYINKNVAIAYTQSLGVSFTKKDYEEIRKTHWDYTEFPDDFMNISYYSTPEDMVREIQHHKIEIVEHIATDGLYTLFKQEFESITEQEFQDVLSFHIDMANVPSSLGASAHNLIICRNSVRHRA